MKELEVRTVLENMSEEEIETYSISVQNAWNKIHAGNTARLNSHVVREISLRNDADYMAWVEYNNAIEERNRIYSLYDNITECSINDWTKAYTECSDKVEMLPEHKEALAQIRETINKCHKGYVSWCKITGRGF